MGKISSRVISMIIITCLALFAGVAVNNILGNMYGVPVGVDAEILESMYMILGATWAGIILVCALVGGWILQEYRKRHIKIQQMEKSENLMVVRVNESGNIVFANQYIRKKLGYNKGELEGQNIKQILCEYDYKRFQDLLTDTESKLSKSSMDFTFRTAKSQKVYTICTVKWEMKMLSELHPQTFLEVSAIAIEDYRLATKNSDEIRGLYEEIASSEEEIQRRFEELCEKQEALHTSEQRYGLVVETASMGIWDYDFRTEELFVSPKFKEILGIFEYDRKYFIHLTKIHPNDRPKLKQLNEEAKSGKRDGYEVECRTMHPERGYIWIYIICKWLRDEEGNLTRIAGSMTDVHQKKIDQDKIKHIAYYDELTGMTNKSYLKDRFLKYKPRECALIHMDIDNFKFINDSFGHEYGDLALKEIGERLKQLAGKRIKISRIGADEFAILMMNVASKGEIEKCLEGIGELFKEPFKIKDIKSGLSYSAGIAIYPYDADTFEELTTSADTALHKAKEAGKRRYMFYDQQFKATILEKIHMENDLRHGIKNKEFVLHYQPQASVKDGTIKGFEALIRWVKPDGTMIAPFKFIDIAEETGLIIPIGAWVIEEACLFINRLQTMGYDDLYVAVNISVIQLAQDDFVETVEKILNDTKVDATRLHIEITETMLMESIDKNIEKINRIKQRGVLISLDDFGKGYSSLTYLKQLPINVLKIEKAFIDDIIEDNKKNITGAIINLGHELSLEVVAEGVEEKAQWDYLENCKCDMIQGYFISKPIPEREVFTFLSNKVSS